MQQQDNNSNEWAAVPLEQAILGACILEQGAIDRVVVELQPEMFYDVKHQIIFKALKGLFQEGSPIDILTVRAKLSKEFSYQYLDNFVDKEERAIKQTGGSFYLAKLTSQVASAANIEYHAKLVIELWLKRELFKKCQETMNKLQNEVSLDVFEELYKMEESILSLQNRTVADTGEIEKIATELAQYEEDRHDNPQDIVRFETGFKDLDRLVTTTTGMLVLIAARPSMGKTGLMLNIAKNMAKNGLPCAIFSLEMPRVKLVKRIALSENLSIDTTFINQLDKMHPEHYLNYQTEIEKAKKLQMYIFGIECNSIIAMRSKLVGLKKKGVKVVFIDYLQLIKNPSKKAQNREQEVAEISRQLSEMALSLDMLIISLSQLSRAVETRGGDKKPMMSDIRESGSIEQDCRVIMALYRPEYYGFETDENGNSTKGLAQVIVLKQNEGGLGTVDLKFHGSHFLFTNKDAGSGNYFPEGNTTDIF